MSSLTTWIFVLLAIATTALGISEDYLDDAELGVPGLDASFDYVVVGAGAGGLTLAARLAQHRYRVALVEAGDFYELKYPLAAVPGAGIIGIGSDVNSSTPVDWRFVAYNVPGANYRDLHYPRGKCLGGSTGSNMMVYQRPNREAMQRWAELVDDNSYTFDRILPFFQRTANFTPPNNDIRHSNATAAFNLGAFDERGEPLQVSYPDFAVPFSSWIKRGMESVGIPEIEDFNSGFLLGAQYCALTIDPHKKIRSSSEAAFKSSPIPRLMTLALYKKTMAKRILINTERRATGVEGIDFLAFEKVPDELRSQFSDETIRDLSWFPPGWPEIEYIPVALYLGDFSDPIKHQPQDGAQYASIAGALVAPTSRGNVTIISDDTDDLPIINPNWLATKTDEEVAVAIYRRNREIFRSPGMEPIIDGEEYFPGEEFQTDSEILGVIKDTLMTVYHASCTCKMGVRNDSMAVVDSQARVFGVDGLRVVDASAFPFLPPGHPQSVVYMLAEKIASDIISWD
ncbi:hypothetical protein AtubIFM57143_011160 [Aspergillus tubingensis]|nr:hypothetical protein AtubIFM57143_011160 [Aspergillus tubingensis]